MTRLRTHNNRARRLPYAVYKARVKRATKIARYAVMYGAGPRKMREALQSLGHAAQNAATEFARYREVWPHQKAFIDKYFRDEHGELIPNTVTGRMVSPGPNFNYTMPKGTGKAGT